MTKGPENNDTHLHYLSLEYTANSNIIVKQYIVKWTKIKAASGVSLLPHCIRVIGVILKKTAKSTNNKLKKKHKDK